MIVQTVKGDALQVKRAQEKNPRGILSRKS